MTEDRQKKQITAGIAAVMAYLQFEQEAIPPDMVEAEVEPAAPIRVWGISGRQALMQNRTLMQMRAFK